MNSLTMKFITHTVLVFLLVSVAAVACSSYGTGSDKSFANFYEMQEHRIRQHNHIHWENLSLKRIHKPRRRNATCMGKLQLPSCWLLWTRYNIHSSIWCLSLLYPRKRHWEKWYDIQVIWCPMLKSRSVV